MESLAHCTPATPTKKRSVFIPDLNCYEEIPDIVEFRYVPVSLEKSGTGSSGSSKMMSPPLAPITPEKEGEGLGGGSRKRRVEEFGVLHNLEIEAKIVGGEGEGSEEEGVEEIDLNKSPKKKVTRRKKHRPKVVFDDKKVVKSPKVVTPKKAGEKKERVVPKRVATQKKKGLDTPEKVEEGGESVMGMEKSLSEQDTTAVEISTNKGKRVIAKTYIRKKKLLSSLDTPLDKSKEVKVPEKTYVRRQRGSNATTMTESAARGTVDELPVNAVKSVRRRLSFGVEDEDKSRPEFTAELPAGIVIDLNRSLNQGLEEYLGLSEDPALSTLSCRSEIIRESMVVTDVIENVENGVAMQGEYEKADSDSCKNGILIDDDTEKTGTKRNHDHSSVIQHCCTDDFLGDACFLGGYTEVKKTSLWQGMGNLIEYFPIVHKKRRTNRGKPWGSNRAIMNNFGYHAFADAQNSTKLDKLEQSSLLPTFDQIRIITKKRSKIPNRARKLTTLACSRLLWYPEKIEESLDKPENRSHDSQTCMEALAADTRFRIITKKPRNKVHYDLARSSLNNEIPKQSFVVGLSESSAGDWKNLQTYKIGGSFYTCFESLAVVPYMDPTENIVEKMKHLYLNENQVDHISKMHNSLIPYGGDSMMVPYRNLFDQFKKRRLRAKVDLDPETNRAWNLLMGNKHNNEADNAEMDKKKWEEERKIFHGRAELFIARMHLILGDRRFSKWNGSVVDSVVGVFLTQNVSDHLSSSAFMALAAKYPLKSKGNSSEANDEKRSASTEQGDGSILDSDDTVDSEENVMVPEANYAGSEEKENETSEIRISPGSNNRNETDYLEGRDQEIGLDTTQNGTYTQVTAPVVIVLEDSDDETSMQDLVSSQNSVTSLEKNSEHLIQTTLVAEVPIIKNKYSGLDNPTSIVANMFIRETNTTHKSYPNRDGETLASEYIDTVYEDKDYLIVEKKNNSSEKLDGLGNDSDITKIFYVEIVEESPTSGQAKEVEPQASGSKLCSHTSTTSETQIFLEKHYGCRNSNTNEKLEDSLEESISHKCPQVEDENTVIVHPKEIYADFKVENICQEFCREQSKCMRAHNELEAAAESVKMTEFNLKDEACCSQIYQPDMVEGISQATKVNAESEKKKMNHWENLRKEAFMNGAKNERSSEELDSLDWEAVRNADATEIAHTIRERGMNNVLAQRIKDFLNRLVEDHGSIDLEWLKHIPPAEVKEYLLSIRGLGIKSVECVRLLTLQHLAFPVDTNVGRICVRLGWVPLQPLPESLQLHLLELYPMIEHIQKYLWPRLCHLDQRTLYELHYQMITFGKVFCTKTKPNCNACPMRGECKHFASAFASARLALSGPEEKRIVTSRNPSTFENEGKPGFSSILRPLLENSQLSRGSVGNNNEPVIEEPATPEQSEPIIEEPATPEHERIETLKHDIEDAFYEDPDEIPTIKLSFEEFKNNLISYMQENNVDIQDDNMSKALVAITPDVASIPMPKLKNISRLRTEHHVYELPDSHPLLEGIDRRVPDDPCPYLLAIWTPGETAQSTEPPQSCCNSQGSAKLCDMKTCFACNSKRETHAQTVRGTLLIPCRTAMRGSFPLNGTYFQVNEVFADHGSSHMPINVPREWIWNLPRRTVYFGSSVSTIFKGLTTEGIQQCFWRGFVCVRGFDRKSRAPKPLYARLHFPPSKAVKKNKNKGTTGGMTT